MSAHHTYRAEDAPAAFAEARNILSPEQAGQEAAACLSCLDCMTQATTI